MRVAGDPLLHLPSFLHGARSAVSRKARAEGLRCAKHYLTHGVLPHPRELVAVAPGEVVFVSNDVDFERERPAWRLHVLTELVMSLCEGLDERKHVQISYMYEEFFRETPWGGLYFATAGLAPESAGRTALRIEAVLRSWDSLQHGSYLFQAFNTLLDLEGLMRAACGWALEAWCPEGGDSLRSSLEVAAARMAQATRVDCVEAILRRLPQLLPLAMSQRLNHPEVVTDLSAWREYLLELEASQFERVSGVCPAWVLERLYAWDRELDLQ